MLRDSWDIRNLLLFELWINSALRISDLLKVTVWDVFDENMNPKDDFRTKEKKTGKNNLVTMPSKVQETLKEYKTKYPWIVAKPEHYLFFRRKKFQSKEEELGSHSINPCMAWNLVSTRCRRIGLKWSYGTHTLRKTWWFQARKQNKPLELIQHKLNHSSLSVTKRYLGITDDELRQVCNDLNL